MNDAGVDLLLAAVKPKDLNEFGVLIAIFRITLFACDQDRNAINVPYINRGQQTIHLEITLHNVLRVHMRSEVCGRAACIVCHVMSEEDAQ